MGSTSSDRWQTPATFQGKFRKQVGQTERAEELLPAQAESWAKRQWPTPAARDHKGANSREHVTTNGTGRKHMDQLPNFVAHASHQARMTQPDGPIGSEPAPVLNPLFVAALMGLPIGWTACEVSETEWSRYRRQQRSALSRIAPWRRSSEEEAA